MNRNDACLHQNDFKGQELSSLAFHTGHSQYEALWVQTGPLSAQYKQHLCGHVLSSVGLVHSLYL